MYISCYRSDETNFEHQGKFKVYVDEEENNIYRALNGQFYATFKVPITDIFVENLVPRMIVKIPTPNRKNPMQLFRIVDYDEDENGDINFTAFPIAWDLASGFLPHINIVGQTRKQAAEYILEKAKETQSHRFNIIDKDDPKEQKNLQVVRYSPLVALMGNKDNTLLNRYVNTEFDFNNFDIEISNKIGTDTGFLIKDNKNITSSNKNLDYKPIATRIIPQGSDELLLPEYYIDSPKIDHYDQIFYKHVIFNDIGINEEEGITQDKAIEMLREAAMALFTQQKIDEPFLSWTIDFDDMQSNNKIHKKLKQLLKLDIGDTVIVTKQKLSNRLEARILEYNYNFAKGKYKDITISNIAKDFTVSLEQSVADINFKIDNFTSIVSNINQTMLSKIEQTEKSILLEVSNKASKSDVSDIIEKNNNSKNMVSNYTALLSLEGYEPLGSTKLERYDSKEFYNNIDNSIVEDTSDFPIIGGDSPGNIDMSVPPNPKPPVNELPIVYPPKLEEIKQDCKIHFIYTGITGDNIFIQFDNGKNMLIDCGEKKGASKIISYLKGIGVRKIDYFVISHHHTDHNSAFVDIADNFDVKGAIAYHRTPDWSKMPSVETGWQTKYYHDLFINKCIEKGIIRKTPREKDILTINKDTSIQFFNTDFSEYSNYNNLSICCLFKYNTMKYFFSGDIMYEAQESLVGKGIGKVQVYKTPHHCLNTKMSKKFIDELSPKTCITTRSGLPKNASTDMGALQVYGYYNHLQYSAGKTIVINCLNHTYSVAPSGSFKFENEWCNLDGSGNWYYFKLGGELAKNEMIVSKGKKYYFDSTGLCTNPNGEVIG